MTVTLRLLVKYNHITLDQECFVFLSFAGAPRIARKFICPYIIILLTISATERT